MLDFGKERLASRPCCRPVGSCFIWRLWRSVLIGGFPQDTACHHSPAQAGGGRGSPSQDRYSRQSSLVLIPVTVTDPLNRFVTGLDKENFKIAEDKVDQIITSFRARTRHFRWRGFRLQRQHGG